MNWIAHFFVEAARCIVGIVTLVVVGIPMMLFGKGKGGPYAVVPLLLAPILVLHFLGLGRDREF